MHKTFCLGLAGIASLLGGFAHADDEPWLRCRSISNPAERLACYDNVKPGAKPATAASAPTRPAASPVPAAAAAPATAAVREQAFGLAPDEREQVQQVRSTIAGLFEGWNARTRLRLANGQVWQVVDGSSAYYQLRDPKVTVKRAAFGSFLMDIEGE